MKTMFIPKGITVRHESVTVDELIVKGELIVDGCIQSKTISGKGIISAGRINAHSVIADIVDCDNIYVKKIIANKIFCTTVKASHGVVATDYIEAYSVKTPRLAMVLSQIENTEANEIISLSPKKRSFVMTLFLAWIRERFATWQHENAIKENYTKPTDAKTSESAKGIDAETEKIIESYKEMCAKGYKLVLEPVEPIKTAKSA